MRPCPRCAEPIREAATFCRHCRSEVWPATGLPPNRVGQAIGAILAASLLAYCVSVTNTGQPPAAPARVAAATVEKCRRLLADAEQLRVIHRRTATRIDVDDALWSDISAETKTGLLRAVACVTRPSGTLDGVDRVAAYGHRSGKRLALLTAVGVSYE